MYWVNGKCETQLKTLNNKEEGDIKDGSRGEDKIMSVFACGLDFSTQFYSHASPPPFLFLSTYPLSSSLLVHYLNDMHIHIYTLIFFKFGHPTLFQTKYKRYVGI